MAGKYYLLDTFTRERFKGNPTPVCLLIKTLSAETMHSLAKEFNAPVTAFIEPAVNNDIYPIRYFTITGEIPACGHATLGAAFALLSQTKSEEITFLTIERVKLNSRMKGDTIFITYPKFKGARFAFPRI